MKEFDFRYEMWRHSFLWRELYNISISFLFNISFSEIKLHRTCFERKNIYRTLGSHDLLKQNIDIPKNFYWVLVWKTHMTYRNYTMRYTSKQIHFGKYMMQNKFTTENMGKARSITDEIQCTYLIHYTYTL